MVESGQEPSWYRSSRCGSESGCVEVARINETTVAVRDSKLPGGSPFLMFDRQTWATFIGAVKADEYTIS
jgi:hypothetical protein